MIANSISTPLWSDESLLEPDIDGRSAFAQAIAARIDCCVVGQSSTVFGVVGPWGSGKTTLLRAITQQLDPWKVVWFSPWSVADVGSITAEFVSALAGAFPQSPDLMSRIVSYSRFGTPMLKLIPFVGDTAAGLASEAIAELSKRPPWHSEFAKLSDEIAKQEERVLVIVDDVDRLDGNELRSLLRVVRLLGRFENVHYLMAYDQATIDGMLSTVNATGESSEFMEKIVQYPFEVPPVPMVIRRRWTRAILDAVNPEIDRMSENQAGHRERLVDVLSAGVETPRAVNRLREQIFSLSALIANAEVDILDFVLLTWLRVAHHRVWDDIRLNEDFYISWSKPDTNGSEKLERIQTLIGPRGRVKPIQDALTFLFEPMSLDGTITGRRWRMQHSRYFERYFQIGLAENDVSERKVEEALASYLSGRDETQSAGYFREVVFGEDLERSALALKTASDFRRNGTTTSLALLHFLSEILSSLDPEQARYSIRLPTVDRWLAREIYLALKSNITTISDLVEKFGYSRLATSAYVVTRSPREEQEQVKPLYRLLADQWLLEVRSEPISLTLARPELLQMTTFCIWFDDAESLGGFLSDRIDSATKLVDAAATFVSFNEWVGSDVRYDAVFRTEEFKFAVSDLTAESVISEVPSEKDLSQYELVDRTDRELPLEQLRDYASNSVRSLYISNSEEGSG